MIQKAQAAAGERDRGADEQALIRKARAGDLEAFEALLRVHEDPVYSVVWRLTGNDEEAEAVTAAVFLTAWRRLREIGDGTRLRTWFLDLAFGALRERGHGFGADGAGMAEADGAVAIVAGCQPAPLPDRQSAPLPDCQPARLPVDHQPAALPLEERIRELAPALRAAVVLRFIERLPCEDVAAILREDVACVQARLHEACRTLCRRLDGHLKE